MSGQMRGIAIDPDNATDTVVEEFLARYKVAGSNELCPAVADNAEARYLEEIANVRFVGQSIR